jgi:hypothetical protein
MVGPLSFLKPRDALQSLRVSQAQERLLLTGFIWRFVWALRPLASNFVAFRTWCDPDRGLAGFHAGSVGGRCPTCKRRTTKAAP